MNPPPLPPIERSISVSWNPQAAFNRFATEVGSWWPARSHSIGWPHVQRVVLKPRVGGRIFEEHRDGRRFQWGQVLKWSPPQCVRFTWHPSREPSTAQEVAVEFTPEGAGTCVKLTSTGWDRWGPKARLARRGYRVGWGYVLNVWAGRRTLRMSILDAIAGVIGVIQKVRGGNEAAIDRAAGEIPPA